MSFLNALASDGLSVGLRFYNARMNNRVNEEPAVQSPAVAEESGCQAKVENVKPKLPPKPQETAEEMAAGRAEAKARLAADGSLGQLAASQSHGSEEAKANQAAPAADEAEGGQAAAPAPVSGGGKQLTPEEEKEVEWLKAQEAQIKAEVAASVQKGVQGADSVQFSYTKGPDDNRYISGIQGGQSGAGNPAASVDENSGGARQLSAEERQQVEDMKQRDREVRTHEQAHMTAAAGLAGAPVYEYQTGPDGKRYAVGGHVDIRTSGSSDPEVALREAEAVKRAANAPADPSGPDQAAAARASAQINRIKAEKASQAMSNEDEAKADDLADGYFGRAKESGSRLAEDSPGIFNGSTFSRQVVGAYAAVKFGSASMTSRPVLAQA